MIEDEAYRSLWHYLKRVDDNASLIDPTREKLVEIVRDNQSAPRPKGPYAMIQFVTDRDTGEIDGECYEDRDIGGEDRVVLSKHRGVELLIRVHVYSPRPVDHAGLLQAGLRSGEAAVWMAPFVIREVGQATRAPEMIQQSPEGRAFFDVTIGAIATNQLLVDVIETGEVITEGAGGSTVTTSSTYAKP
ncbi:MAG TPA: hypothetical protein VGN82_14245 [Bosea sp. (in: a-proteobacteria)]|jgi:hypothetical protein|uniref:phage neck terminator protein n=1 Tax=Bosea sp. (in: a-proteobacteria) TaxID=1871050 RepID=UPI002E1324C9|nr:hypothetical protein [Bosea sp. (in: a-proteobacteria)]